MARIVVDELRAAGLRVGVFKIRFLRPFPEEELISLAKHVKGIGVLEKDVSFGHEGTVYTNVNSAIAKARTSIPSYNFVAGLGGRDISKDNVFEMFQYIKEGVEGTKKDYVKFIGLGVEINE